MDKLDVYEDFMMERLEQLREEKKKARRRVARKRREKYLKLLDGYREELSNDISWPDFAPLIKQSSEYIELVGTRNSSQPYDLFAETRSKWKRERSSNMKRERSNSPIGDDPSSKRPKE